MNTRRPCAWLLAAVGAALAPDSLVQAATSGAAKCAALPQAALVERGHFEALLHGVAEGWNANRAADAAACFAEDAVYVEPPDKQRYVGREALFEFFGGADGRDEPMAMTWHDRVFDATTQRGFAEFTFESGGWRCHGTVAIEVRDGRIARWREYWYESQLDFAAFVGPSAFGPPPPAAAVSVADEVELRRIKTEEWPRVYREQDVAGLDRLLHPGFAMLDDAGKRSTKADELAWVRDNKPSYRSFRFEIERLDVYPNGVAIVDGSGHAEHDACAGYRYRSSNVLVKHEGRWRAIASHVSGVSQHRRPDPACAAKP